jgi:hypothetical protein
MGDNVKDILTFKVKRPRKKAQPRKRNKENDLDRKLVYITRVISRGDYDPNKPYHVIMANVARAHGIIDKDNNILKEEYLLCQTKR